MYSFLLRYRPDDDLRWFLWEDCLEDLEIDSVTNVRG